MINLHHGDCLEVLRTMADNSVDAVVTDPPYGLSFMGKKWDYDVPSVEVWAECLRVLKPGGHLLAFAGTRTQHRMAVRIEDAGFEIRDMIAWVYGSGFPKSLDVSKAIDKAAGVERPVLDTIPDRWAGKGNVLQRATQAEAESVNITAPATEAARQWQGWGTALKPSAEPLTLARKPLDWRGLCLSLAQYLTSQLCQYSASVKDAGPSSASSPSASSAGQSDSVLWTAVERCNTPGDLFALMDTLPSGSEIPTTLSTALSWLRTLDGLLKHESTFTTETVSSLTTDLRTLNSLLSRNTQGTIIAELTQPNGRGSGAELVACIFSACDASLKSTLARSVHASAIVQAQENYLDAGASPAMEPVTVARKPLVGTVAENVLEHGTGALNIDGCRVGTEKDVPGAVKTGKPIMAESWLKKHGHGSGYGPREMDQSGMNPNIGRWPANLIHDGSDEVLSAFPLTTTGVCNRWSGGGYSGGFRKRNEKEPAPNCGDTGSAARFFYCAKASKADRGDDNAHPTVKPTDLMRYLCRLVSPPGGTVLDPFMGSGSTGRGAVLEGFDFIGIEREAEYIPIARARIEAAQRQYQPTLFDQPKPEPVQLTIE